MRPLMVTCATPSQAASSTTRNVSMVFSGGCDLNYVRRSPTVFYVRKIKWGCRPGKQMDDPTLFRVRCWCMVVVRQWTNLPKTPWTSGRSTTKTIAPLSNYRQCAQGLSAVRTGRLSKSLCPVWRQYETRRYRLRLVTLVSILPVRPLHIIPP